MKRMLSVLGIGVAAAVLLTAGRANACVFTQESAAPDCSAPKICFSGAQLPEGGIFFVKYQIDIASASPASVAAEFFVERQPDGTFSACETRTWADLGVTLSGTVQLSGNAELWGQWGDAAAVQDFAVIPFSTTPLVCEPPPPGCTGAIGDFVWNDLNHDGVQQSGEPGLANVTLALSGPGGGQLATTDASGHYLFSNLCPGDYTVTVNGSTLPAGFVPTTALVPPPATDSNGSPAAVTLSGSDLTIDFGFFAGQLACPAGGFTFFSSANGDLNMVFDQFPAPNDNSYGANAVGWQNGHRFSDLVGSDHAGFQLVDPGGVVRLSFNIDYLTASSAAPSGFASLGPFGGDGKVLVGTLTAADIAWDTSLARNLNGQNIPGLFNSGHVQQLGSVNVLVDSPPTDAQHLTYAISDPGLAGWDFHDTYFVTLKASKLAAMGFNANWRVEPNLDALHNSPAKPCPPAPGSEALSVTKREVKDKQVKVTILNSGTADTFVTGLQLSWPAANGKLMQVKLDGDVIYDAPDLLPPSATLTAAQLVADQNKRKIQHGQSDVLTLIFEKNADPAFSSYAGVLSTSGGSTLTFLP